MNRGQLVDAAVELNQVLGLEPKIDVKLANKPLRQKLGEAAQLLAEEDEVSDATLDVVTSLGNGGASETKTATTKPPTEGTKPPTEGTKPAKPSGTGTHEGSMAQFIDQAMLSGPISWDDLCSKVTAEGERRELKKGTSVGILRQHAKHRDKSKKYSVKMDENEVSMALTE